MGPLYFIEYEQDISVASDDLYEYTMRRTPETVAKDYETVYYRFREIERVDIMAMKWNGIIDPDYDGYHEVMKILSQELKFYYERKEKN